MTELQNISATPSAVTPSPTQLLKIEQKAEEFEAAMLSALMAPILNAANSESPFGNKSAGSDAYQSMMNDAFARAIAAKGGIVIADSVKDALIRIQTENQFQGHQDTP